MRPDKLMHCFDTAIGAEVDIAVKGGDIAFPVDLCLKHGPADLNQPVFFFIASAVRNDEQGARPCFAEDLKLFSLVLGTDPDLDRNRNIYQKFFFHRFYYSGFSDFHMGVFLTIC